MIHVVGHTAIDNICKVERLPAKNSSIGIDTRKILFGGGAANIAAGIAVLGGEVTLHSAVGGDFINSEYESWMENLGVKRNFFIVKDAHTATAFMFTDKNGDQITFFEWGASVAFTENRAPSLPFVHMATADPAFNVQVAEKSEFATFDPGQDLYKYSKSDLQAILGNIQILFSNEHEMKGMCEILGKTVHEITTKVPVTVVTEGGNGSSLYYDGKKTHIPIVKVTLADPTGAGDAYRAGFLTGYKKGYSLPECAKIGTVTSSFVVEKEGCQTNLADWNTMKNRYEQNFGPLSEL